MDKIAVLSDIACEAASFMVGGNTDATEKSGIKDFVTVSDIKAQNIITKRLAEKFPGVQVVSEEHTEAERQVIFSPDFSGFVIDPIDGTYNFKRDMRESAISIGYIEAGEPQYGVVFDPYRDELFAAEKGKGATRNGIPIHVSDQEVMAGASVATSNGYDDAAAVRNFKRHLSIYESTGTMPWSSCPGSVILVLVWIACGRIDALHHNGIKPWDCAASYLIVREAGGVVHDLRGSEAEFTNPLVLAGTPKIVAELERIFKTIDQTLLS